MTGLRAWAAAERATARAPSPDGGRPSTPRGGGGGLGSGAWARLVTGGRPARPDARAAIGTLYCTGHQDGTVRLWDAYGSAPLPLGAAPSAEAAAALAGRGAAAAPVSTLEFAWEQGLLISGHEGGEVRVYQFSERARTTEVSHLESIGVAGPDARTAVSEPPGFQLRLQSLVHSADITCSAYNPSFKFVAVGDRAGAVTLVDLSRPALLWLQTPLKSPAVSLALARCPLPPRRARNGLVSERLAGAPDGAPVRAVVAVGADSSVVVLDAASGFALSKRGALRPKHPSRALAVEALDAGGAPVWMARDVGYLVELCRERGLARDSGAPPEGGGDSGSSPRGGLAAPGKERANGRGSPDALAAGPSPKRPRGPAPPRPDERAGGSASPLVEAGAERPRRVPGQRAAEGRARGGGKRALGEGREAAAARWQRGGEEDEGGQGEEEEEAAESEEEGVEEEQQGGRPGAAAAEEDLDALLASAAAQVEAEDRARRWRGGAGGGSQRRSQRQRSLGRRSKPSQGAASASRRGAGAGAELCAGDDGDPSGLAGSSSEAAPSPAAAPTAARPRSSSRGPRPTSPAQGQGQQQQKGGGLVLEDPEASYVLVATENYLRLYPAASAACGERGAARRVELPGPLRFASAFAAGGAPALACLLRRPGGDDLLSIYTLPGLVLATQTPLSACCGWRWPWEPEPPAPPAGAAAARPPPPDATACTRHGDLALLGAGRELLRLSLDASAPPPAPPGCLVDWDLAAAAHAAGVAYDEARRAAGARARAEPRGGDAAAGAGGGARPAAAAGGGPVATTTAAAAAAGRAGGGASSGEAGAGEDEEAEAGAARPDFRRFMARIGQDFQKAGGQVAHGFQRAFDETQKGLQKVAQEVKELPGLLVPRPREEPPPYPYPELAVIFAGGGGGGGGAAAAPHAASGAAPAAEAPNRGGAAAGTGGATKRQPEGLAASGRAAEARGRREAGGAASVPAPAAPAAAPPAPPPPLSPSVAAGARAEAAAAASPAAAGGSARVRTAAEIRAAYGRPLPSSLEGAHARASLLAGAPAQAGSGGGAGGAAAAGQHAAPGARSAAAAMEENVRRLGARGEALGRLQEKGAALEDSAATFAEAARRLREGR
ncbi:hypothetical protein Rsub_03818 [Raphidocelis subcapitata]|uniref:V-SNARE coiled-coil homology domain-containing protein n=1 Tax=Raphidocelis subcapitata TaxID=307507 RepID=A0A2V0NZF2_9CHLO|nr:hypothetical protein Rsub_03818 [Raphidocelis subcapitata]|eukprot:GBF90963.1 hypothetical protein Rsub_03818 [Raphidocelis subcapitata]